MVAYCRAVCRAEQQWRPGICGGWYWRVSNSIRLRENIYVLDGTLSHISHKTFFLHDIKENEINFARVSTRIFIVRCEIASQIALITFWLSFILKKRETQRNYCYVLWIAAIIIAVSFKYYCIFIPFEQRSY